MLLNVKYLENIAAHNSLINENLYAERDAELKRVSIEKFETRFIKFWEDFKLDVEQGEYSFFMVIDSQNHLPHLLAMLELVKTIDITETIVGHETIIITLRDMISENMWIEIIAKNGGLSFIKLVDSANLLSDYTIATIPVSPT